MATLNYSTTIAASKTLGEIQQLLADHGAARIGLDYDAGRAVGVTFTLATPHGPRSFRLPADVPAMHRLLITEDAAGKLKAGTKATRSSLEQAERVAWRIIKDWLAAQLALVASQMVTVDQAMLAYLLVDDDHTLYEVYRARELAVTEPLPALTAGP